MLNTNSRTAQVAEIVDPNSESFFYVGWFLAAQIGYYRVRTSRLISAGVMRYPSIALRFLLFIPFNILAAREYSQLFASTPLQ